MFSLLPQYNQLFDDQLLVASPLASALVAGKNRVPRPAAGIIAFSLVSSCSLHSELTLVKVSHFTFCQL